MHPTITTVGFIALYIICNEYSDAAVGKVFTAVVSDGINEGLCATKVPSKEEFASSHIHCGVLCTVEPNCTYFSHIEETQKCLIFNSSPITFASVSSCYSYKTLVSIAICNIL